MPCLRMASRSGSGTPCLPTSLISKGSGISWTVAREGDSMSDFALDPVARSPRQHVGQEQGCGAQPGQPGQRPPETVFGRGAEPDNQRAGGYDGEEADEGNDGAD